MGFEFWRSANTPVRSRGLHSYLGALLQHSPLERRELTTLNLSGLIHFNSRVMEIAEIKHGMLRVWNEVELSTNGCEDMQFQNG